MSQLSRMIEVCPGSRRLRAEGRRLCLCGGAPGGPCNDPPPETPCTQRALTGDTRDRCGGLNMPLHKLGLTFHVELSATVISVLDVLYEAAGQHYTNNAVAIFSVAFDVCPLIAPVPPYYYGIHNYVGVWSIGGTATPYHTSLPPPSLVNVGPLSGTFMPSNVFGGPPITSASIFRESLYHEVDECPPFGQGSQWIDRWCALVYPRPLHAYRLAHEHLGSVATMEAGVPDGRSMLTRFIDQIALQYGGPTAQVNGYFGSMFSSSQSALPWYTADCQGQQEFPSPGILDRETWDSVVAPRETTIDLFRERLYLPPFQEGFFQTSWRATVKVRPIVPCPESAGASGLNADLIERHMARGFRAGCCG